MLDRFRADASRHRQRAAELAAQPVYSLVFTLKEWNAWLRWLRKINAYQRRETPPAAAPVQFKIDYDGSSLTSALDLAVALIKQRQATAETRADTDADHPDLS